MKILPSCNIPIRQQEKPIIPKFTLGIYLVKIKTQKEEFNSEILVNFVIPKFKMGCRPVSSDIEEIVLVVKLTQCIILAIYTF